MIASIPDIIAPDATFVPPRDAPRWRRLRRRDRGWVSGIPTNDPADCYFPASSTQPDRFIPNRSALDLDIAHYNLVKENANANDLDLAAEVASPSKVRRLLRQRPIRDDPRSSIESNKTFFTPRSRSFSPADLSSTEH
jgi:hypothetical protein